MNLCGLLTSGDVLGADDEEGCRLPVGHNRATFLAIKASLPNGA